MELRNASKDENERIREDSSVVETSGTGNGVDAGKAGEVVIVSDTGKDANEVVETSAEDEASVDVNNREEETLKVPSARVSANASSSGVKKPKGLLAKKKTVKRVKKLVKKQVVKGTAVQVAGEENVTVEQSAEPSLLNAEDSVADSPQCSSGKEKDSETYLLENDIDTKKELESSPDDAEKVCEEKGKGIVMEAEKVVEASVIAENVLLVEKQQPKKLGAKAELRKVQPALVVKTDVDIRAPELEESGQKNNDSLAVNEQLDCVGDLNSLQVNTSEAMPEQLLSVAENKRRKKKRRGKQVLGSNKKQKNEEVVAVAASDATQQRAEEKKEQLENRETDGQGKTKAAGLIFMCNAKTRPDCFRFSVMGVQEKRKDYVMGIKPGIKLFLYDYDLKLMYGVFQASSVGGMKLERNAFGGSFPAQVRFKVVTDCLPLPESQFKKAIAENYNNRNKFKTELTRKQVFKLTKLFRPATLPAQLTHTLPNPVPRDSERKRSDRDHYAPGSSSSSRTHTHERSRNPHPPLREEPPRDLYLSEREYRTYGLRRESYQIPPPDSSYTDSVPYESYRPSLDHLRNAEMERSDRLLRDYHLSSRARYSPDHAVALESYTRDPPPRYRYEYHRSSPERPPPRAYLASLGREDDDLYSRYVTADSLAEYYRSSSSHRYPSIAESELLPSSRYAYPGGSLPYSHRL